MNKIENIKLIVSLTMAKVDILKLKTTNGGYDWSHIDTASQEQLEGTLVDINHILESLRK